MYISDVIGDEFKEWGAGRVVIEAGTGCGKTTFITNNLLSWIREQWPNGEEGHRILYLCNRVSLKSDVCERLQTIGAIDENENMVGIDVESYQKIERLLIENRDKVDQIMQKYSHVVADECHYFTSDSEFNENTDISYFWLKSLLGQKTVIYMSATAKVLFEGWNRIEKYSPDWYYTVEKDYSYIDSVTMYENDRQLYGILDEIPENEKALVFVKSIKRINKMKEKYGDSAGYYCSSSNEHGGMDKLKDCIENGIMKKQFIIATTALYNGIDIKDAALKHIIIELENPIEIEQAMGRKRPLDKEDTCRLYLKNITQEEVENELNDVKALLAPGEAWFAKKTKNDDNAWKQFFHNYKHKAKGKAQCARQCNAGQLIDRRVTLLLDHYNCKYKVHKMAINELRHRKKVLEKMQRSKNRGFFKTIKEDMFDGMGIKCEWYLYPELREYLDENVGIPMKKEKMRADINQLGMFDRSVKGRTGEMGIRKLNEWLEFTPYRIISKRDVNRASETYGERLWRIERDE